MSDFAIKLTVKGSVTTHVRDIHIDDNLTDTEKMMAIMQASEKLIGDKVDIEFIEKR